MDGAVPPALDAHPPGRPAQALAAARAAIGQLQAELNSTVGLGGRTLARVDPLN